MSLPEMVVRNGIGWQESFLDAGSCARLVRELRYALWRPSQVVHALPGGGVTSGSSTARVSETADQRWFNRHALGVLAQIEERLLEMFSLQRDHLELWQAVSYRAGGRFVVHHDAGLFAREPAGERVLTFLLYLKAPADGGETTFPELDLRVVPAAGTLVAWCNLTDGGRPDPRVRHAAAPVQKGRKVVLTTWSRQAPIRPWTDSESPR
jgi:prolyl 4-hydroxylase